MKVIAKQDLILGKASGDIAGLLVPDNLKDVPLKQLRVVNGNVEDISSNRDWFIDPQGQKHITQYESHWQNLNCAWDDELIYTDVWNVVDEQVYIKRDIKIGEARLDAIADEIYTKSASRAARYERKMEQALAFKDAGYPAPADENMYPFIVQEAAVRGISENIMADLILEKSQGFELFGAFVESERVRLKMELTNAGADTELRQTILSNIIESVETEKAALLNS